jgi:preprotein translocase SecE subunit
MAMAVAESSLATKTQTGPHAAGVGLASLAGGLVLLLGFGLVFGALPVFWTDVLPTKAMNDFLSSTLLLIAGIAAIVAVCYAWYKLDKNYAAHGVRAGSFVAAAVIFFAAWLTFRIGNETESQEGFGMFMTLLAGGLMAAGIVFVFTREGFGAWLGRLEDGGWFTNRSFKGSQGVRVRRATVAGLLIIGLSGIYAMVSHHVFGSTRAGTENWFWRVPFSSNGETFLYLPLLSRINMLGPILLSALVFWFSWRLVNWPTFADFLIATEAEMNKVSWTSRKRLITDTIVVLVAVFIMTTFLFVVDIVWFQILSSPYVNVLHVNLKAEQAKQQEKTQW